MSDRTLVVAALIIGGAIVVASFQMRSRFALSAANSAIAWRMDTWSGQIDICAAGYTPNGPVVKCGTYAGPVPPPDPQTHLPSPSTPPAIPPPDAAPDPTGLGGKEL